MRPSPKSCCGQKQDPKNLYRNKVLDTTLPAKRLIHLTDCHPDNQPEDGTQRKTLLNQDLIAQQKASTGYKKLNLNILLKNTRKYRPSQYKGNIKTYNIKI